MHRAVVATALVLAGCGTPRNTPADALGTPDGDADPCAPTIPDHSPTPIRITLDGVEGTFHSAVSDRGQRLGPGTNIVSAVHAWGVCWNRPPRTNTDVESVRACAYFTVDERTELDLELSWFSSPSDDEGATATIVGANTASLTTCGFGSKTSFTSAWGTPLPSMSTIAPDGTAKTVGVGPEDLVLTGDAGDGTFPVVVARNVAVGPDASPFTVQPSDVQALRSASLSVPPNTSVSHYLLTANGTAIAMPSSETTRYGIPASLEIEGDRYSVAIYSDDGDFIATSRTFGDLVLQPDPLPAITNFSASRTIEELSGRAYEHLAIEWDPYPNAVGYAVTVFAPRYESIVSIWDTTEVYLSSGVVAPPPGCKARFNRRFGVASILSATNGYVQAVTSTAGSGDFPFRLDEAVRGFSPLVRW